MDWQNGRRSDNVEDNREQSSGGFRLGGFRLGWKTSAAVVIIALFTGQDPIKWLGVVNNLSNGASTTQSVSKPYNESNQEKQSADFVSVILADTEDTWTQLLPKYGMNYQPPKLVLFRDEVHSACGLSSSATGPFYCPADKKVYLDLGFFDVLDKSLGAQGDFAQAYVIAHEIGHHLQTLVGTSGKVHQAKQKLSKIQGNALSVKLELQADCYAGVWAHHANKRRKLLEKGDVEEGLNAAASIGDDHLQKRAGKSVNPDGFTHGTSDQRVYWLTQGLKTGDMKACNTFKK